jgi:hypothetical protein
VKIEMPEQLTEHKSIWVYIKLDGEGLASWPELDLRYVLEDAIEERGIGKLDGGGSGGGWMDFSFQVETIDAVAPALKAVKDLLAEYKIPAEDFRFRVLKRYEPVCEESPDFQPGHCLIYRFQDGDYGAALVLNRWKDELNSDETLLGILDYKHQSQPQLSIFEQRLWLIASSDWRAGQPYLVWVHCFGGIEIEVVSRIVLTNIDPNECRFHLSWEDIPEYFIRDKYRGDKVLNPYEVNFDNFPHFLPGDCLTYRFADGDYGAALVLKSSIEVLNIREALLGILDYKQQDPPHLSVFEHRRWLIATQEWRRGQPYLVWAIPQFEDFGGNTVGQIHLRDDDPSICQFGLLWEDIAENVLYEKSIAM